MTASRTYRPRASLAAALLLGAVTIAACGGAHPSSAPVTGSTPADATRGVASARFAPPAAPAIPASVAPTAPAAAPAPASAVSPSASPSAQGAAAQTAAVTQDLSGVSSQLAAAGRDLQDGPTQQTLDPRG